MKRVLALFAVVCLFILTACSSEADSIPAFSSDGVVIALIDTGISTVAISKEHLLPGYNYVLNSDDTEDRINHGTAVASVIAGCESAQVEGFAPEALLVPLVVTDKVDGAIKSVTPDILAQTIRDSIDIYHADIINVSLGIQKDHTALREAIAYATKKSIPVISAVGNDGETGRPYYPASYDAVIAVGSCDKYGDQSDFTQNGADVLAPGESIMLASRNGIPYAVKGTSFSTGFISAYAANLLFKDPYMTPEELFEQIALKAKSGFLSSADQ